MAGIDKTRWQVLSPLLDDLLEAEPDERTELLARIQHDDGALAAELAQLLAHQAHVETAQFLEGSALDFSGSSASVQQVVGNYTLERPLGQGGMGNVWLG